MSYEFVHLKLHTEYSLIDGLLRIDELCDAAKQHQMPAVALSDFTNLFAVVKFYQAAMAAKLKPIIGCEFRVAFDKNIQGSITLYAKNNYGYLRLLELISKCYLQGYQQEQPTLMWQWLQNNSENLILLSGGIDGLFYNAYSHDKIISENLISQAQSLFKDSFYMEIQRLNKDGENNWHQFIINTVKKFHLPVVATNDVRFIAAADFEAHEARVCINQGEVLDNPKRTKLYSKAQYFRSPKEMYELFYDLPNACQNSWNIAMRCTVKLEFGKSYLPNFQAPQNYTIEKYLESLAFDGLQKRWPIIQKLQTINSRNDSYLQYESRLKNELAVINNMGFAGYFLIVADFIAWARKQKIPVGPGRGSGAGSLVAYSLFITDLDPMQYDLLFERFLNPDRVSMPDFDIDFCMDGRDRVIEYVANRYGRQSVSQIITFGTMAAKAVIRDVGRVLGHPYGFTDKLAKLIPFELGITLTKALEQEPELKKRYQQEEDVQELIDLALKLEGVVRNAGKHAGGLVISPSKLTDFAALYCESGSNNVVTQLDKDDVEAVGLVKFDFLGLRTLTIIDWTISIVKNFDDSTTIDLQDIPLNDVETYKLLQQGQTTAVFQLESRGMKELIHRLKPDCFEDIIALVALFRPGPLQSGMVDDFINRKHGRSEVKYLHPLLENILKPTYGVILYQEQVMQIAQVLANYSLGEADLLRRAMGKKKPEEMAKQRAVFLDGASKNNIAADLAGAIFDLMEKFAGYGFNKSHSAAYALIAYHTAWLKTHYPAAFMAAVISSDMDNTEKVVMLLEECKQLKLTVFAPCIQKSLLRFSVENLCTLRYGLAAIKGVGEIAIQGIIFERESHGPYKGLFDFCARLDLRKVNRRVLEALIKSGAMDSWGQNRGVLLASIDKAISYGTQYQKTKTAKQLDLLLEFSENNIIEDYHDAVNLPLAELLQGEKETLGHYLSGHPADQYLKEFNNYLNEVDNVKCGLLNSIKKIQTKRGKKLIILQIESQNNYLDVVVFSEFYEKNPLPAVGTIIFVKGDIKPDDYSGGWRMNASHIYNVSEARILFYKKLVLNILNKLQIDIQEFKNLLQRFPGIMPVELNYHTSGGKINLKLGVEYSINPSDEFFVELRKLVGFELTFPDSLGRHHLLEPAI